MSPRPLLFLWSLLAVRIGLAIVGGESRDDGLALPMVALFVASVTLGLRARSAS